MRPIRLTIRGFTAFRDETVLDFTDLDVFAITGPTGSGKSSLLDAMTYALYGKVERVGSGVRQLVSQGAPRASVVLEFAVGDDRFRVSRSMKAGGGASQILLEEYLPDGRWRNRGEGADRVREAEAEIEKIVGLDYDAFTRAVLLPQDRFAEFLRGDASQRRKILTELLDLGLFTELGQRANELAKSGNAEVATLATVLVDYADATAEAIKIAKADAKRASDRRRLLESAAARVGDLASEERDHRSQASALRAIASEAEAASEDAAARQKTMLTLAATAESHEARAKADEAAVVSAEAGFAKAQTAVANAEKDGTLSDLAEAHGIARQLETARKVLADARIAETQALEAVPVAEALVRDAQHKAGQAAKALEGAHAAVAAAETARDTAHRADLVAAVTVGLRAGDACPVCGIPLKGDPSTAGPDLQHASAVLAEARRVDTQAAQAWRQATKVADSAETKQERARERAVTAAGDRQKAESEESLHLDALRRFFVGGVPADPVVDIEARGKALRQLVKAREAAQVLRDEAREHRDAGHREREVSQRKVIGARGELSGCGRQVAALFERAREAGMPDISSRLPAAFDQGRELPEDAGGLADVAAALAATASTLAASLRESADSNDAESGRLATQAMRAITTILAGHVGEDDLRTWIRAEQGRGPTPATSLSTIGHALEKQVRTAEGALRLADRQITDLETRLAKRKELEAQKLAAEKRARTFKALGDELRGDRIITFLQGEALTLLADGASTHLQTVSAGRYRLEIDGDDFVVVDTWNADEARSVRTLSGGETFLASLSLALALSEQVAALSLGGRRRLESLFLDEGFGSLDPESLDLAYGAIDALGGDGRLVGIVTHVRELADRMPVRVEVAKSPRGSTVHVEAAA